VSAGGFTAKMKPTRSVPHNLELDYYQTKPQRVTMTTTLHSMLTRLLTAQQLVTMYAVVSFYLVGKGGFCPRADFGRGGGLVLLS